jgi:elongation factor P
MLNITDLKKGVLFVLNDEPYRVIEYSQKVMGRGGSIVNVKIKSLINGRVLDKTFKGNEQLESADITTNGVQYLYNDNGVFYFMDQTNFNQFEVPSEIIGDQANYIKDGDTVQLQFFKERPISLALPKNVALKVEYSEEAVKGDTSTAITKNAVLETGLSVKVPAFIKAGDIISIDTLSGTYRERVKG